MKFIYFILFIIFFFPSVILAQTTQRVEVQPAIIDETAESSDILKYNIKVKNNSESKLDIYAVVKDITPEGAEVNYDPNTADDATSLASWIKFSRGVIELMPGEEKSIPLNIKVNLLAKPGKYHAVIVFPEGRNRKIAEENMQQKKYAQALININIGENKVEKAQMQYFGVSNRIYLKFPVKFLVNLNNSGNTPINPQGSIYIYNRRGQEVKEINVNEEMQEVPAESSFNVEKPWYPDKTIGKFKARLVMEYGQDDKRDLQDTVYFWVLPWYLLVIFCLLLLFIIVVLTWLIFRKTYVKYHPQNLEEEEADEEVEFEED